MTLRLYSIIQEKYPIKSKLLWNSFNIKINLRSDARVNGKWIFQAILFPECHCSLWRDFGKYWARVRLALDHLTIIC